MKTLEETVLTVIQSNRTDKNGNELLENVFGDEPTANLKTYFDDFLVEVDDFNADVKKFKRIIKNVQKHKFLNDENVVKEFDILWSDFQEMWGELIDIQFKLGKIK